MLLKLVESTTFAHFSDATTVNVLILPFLLLLLTIHASYALQTNKHSIFVVVAVAAIKL